jgi:hypothetical protein
MAPLEWTAGTGAGGLRAAGAVDAAGYANSPPLGRRGLAGGDGDGDPTGDGGACHAERAASLWDTAPGDQDSDFHPYAQPQP